MGIDAVILCTPRKVLTTDEILDASRRLVRAVGADFFWFGLEGDRHALQLVERGEYDWGVYESGAKQVLSVNTLSRYYGPGYERGNFLKIHGVCEWLEVNVGPVYYGGDSYDELSRWTECAEEYIAHWLGPKTDAYYNYDYARSLDTDLWARVTCGLCGTPMVRNGRGGTYAQVGCLSCGLHGVTNDAGLMWTWERGGRTVDNIPKEVK